VTSRLVRVEIDLVVFEALPWSLDEHVVPPAPRPIHTDLNPVVFQDPGELLPGELTVLIRVEHLWSAILGDRLPHGLETEVRGQHIGEPPGQHSATRPVEDRTEIHEPRCIGM
jgi:hypothetical protein